MRRVFNYSFGAAVTLALSLGCAAIVYGAGLLAFDLFNIPAWIFGPLGVYTLISAILGQATFFYLGWGTILVAIGAVSALYKHVSAVIIVGILLIALGILSLVGYFRVKSN